MTTPKDAIGRLAGKVALITGGSSGIGLATAKQFAQEGARVFITGRDQAKLDAAVGQLGGSVTGIQGDVASMDDLARIFEAFKKEDLQINVLFANAGVTTRAALADLDEAQFDYVFNINVKGLLFTVQKSLPFLSEGASVILNSTAAASKGLASNTLSAGSKEALRAFARTWASELKDRKIRVNTISPGPIETEGHAVAGSSNPEQQEKLKGFLRMIPLGRMGSPDEVAHAVVFLASDESSYITGTELFVDGGFAQV